MIKNKFLKLTITFIFLCLMAISSKVQATTPRPPDDVIRENAKWDKHIKKCWSVFKPKLNELTSEILATEKFKELRDLEIVEARITDCTLPNLVTVDFSFLTPANFSKYSVRYIIRSDATSYMYVIFYTTTKNIENLNREPSGYSFSSGAVFASITSRIQSAESNSRVADFISSSHIKTAEMNRDYVSYSSGSGDMLRFISVSKEVISYLPPMTSNNVVTASTTTSRGELNPSPEVNPLRATAISWWNPFTWHWFTKKHQSSSVTR